MSTNDAVDAVGGNLLGPQPAGSSGQLRGIFAAILLASSQLGPDPSDYEPDETFCS